MEPEVILLVAGLLGGLGLGLGTWRTLTVLRRPPEKARIIYLTPNHENYIRLRSNPGFTIGSFHRCRKGKMCPWRKR